MKRYLILAFSILAFVSVQAQTFNYTGLEIKQEKVKKKNVYEWENFVLANYGLDIISGEGALHHSVGVTYGRVKLFGWYVSAMFGTGVHYGYQYSAWYGKIDGVYPFYTGKNSFNRASLTAGGIVRMVIPLYLYLGVGYGYQSITRQITSEEWVLANENSMKHCMAFDIGLQGNIKGFTLSLGYSFLTNFGPMMHEMKVGIGYTFKDKKK